MCQRVDEPIGLVAEARHAYFRGREDDGRRALGDVQRMKPGLPEAELLEGEFAIRERRFEDAQFILQPLLANISNPEWIRIMAEDLLNRIE